MASFKHVLTEMGVMKTFSIARRISEDDIISLTEKYNKLKKKDMSLTEYLKMSMVKAMESSFRDKSIPGLIFEGTFPTPADQEKMIELTQFSSLVAKKLVEKKLNKFYFCFVVNSLVNMLGLSDKDFDEFHHLFQEFEDDDDDEG